VIKKIKEQEEIDKARVLSEQKKIQEQEKSIAEEFANKISIEQN